jgi:hypothetical protein
MSEQQSSFHEPCPARTLTQCTMTLGATRLHQDMAPRVLARRRPSGHIEQEVILVIAGIDTHKDILAVAVVDETGSSPPAMYPIPRRRCGWGSGGCRPRPPPAAPSGDDSAKRFPGRHLLPAQRVRRRARVGMVLGRRITTHVLHGWIRGTMASRAGLFDRVVLIYNPVNRRIPLTLAERLQAICVADCRRCRSL